MSQFDVLCIGNAIVDIIARCDEAFLVDNTIIKGAMNLIDAERAELLYSRMGPAIEASGGSAGNTAAGIARKVTRGIMVANRSAPPKPSDSSLFWRNFARCSPKRMLLLPIG